jgi:hypothetical protein
MGASQVIRAVPLSAERPGGVISPDEVEAAAVRTGIAYWRRLRGSRLFPSRIDVLPRDIADLLRHTVLMRVVDGGTDYEYRIVGDAHVVAHGFSIQGRCLSTMDEYAPGYGKVLKTLYDPVVRNRAPFALRGWIARGEEQSEYIHSENVFLPLGPDDETVDHVLNFSVYTLPHGAYA